MEDQEDIEKETEEEIKSIRKDFDSNKNQVVDFLINSVLDVNLDIPKVVRGDFAANE